MPTVAGHIHLPEAACTLFLYWHSRLQWLKNRCYLVTQDTEISQCVRSWRGEEEKRGRRKGQRDSENKKVECERLVYMYIYSTMIYTMQPNPTTQALLSHHVV